MIITILFLVLYRAKKYPHILSLLMIIFYMKSKSNIYLLLIGGLLILSYEDVSYYAVYTNHLIMLEGLVFIYLFINHHHIFIYCVVKFIFCLLVIKFCVFIFNLFLNKKSMGEADYEIIALVYMVSNLYTLLLVLWFSCLLGIFYLYLKKKQKLPFIPFLTIAAILIFA